MSLELIDRNIQWHPYVGQDLSLEGSVHLFKIDNQINHETLNYNSILSTAELEKSSRFFRKEDKKSYLVSKYFLRILLSKFVDQQPADIEFQYGINKKPFLNYLNFNISHTNNSILIGISTKPIGVDLEYLDPSFNFQDVLMNCFHPDEIVLINNGFDSTINFYTIWTRKEALLKATGEGLTDDLDQISTLRSTTLRRNENFTIKSFQVDKNILGSIAIVEGHTNFNFWNWELPSISS